MCICLYYCQISSQLQPLATKDMRDKHEMMIIYSSQIFSGVKSPAHMTMSKTLISDDLVTHREHVINIGELE
uniref:Uncharacterized protein n=1 Tax=Arion vulgaris TaxID=1028688 RepID=A0A0B6ZBD4_9EUPU